MLKRMVNAHPLVAITRETHWIPRMVEKHRGVTADGRVTAMLIDRLFEHHRFEQMKVGREKLEKQLRKCPNLLYSDLVSEIFNQFGRRKDKPLVGDKTPTYVRKLPTLLALWPHTRILHLIRDGREVWLSMRNWRMAHKAAGKFASWRTDPLVTTALWWRALVSIGRRDARLLPPTQYLELRYEDLVGSAERECDRIADFLQLPRARSMHRFYEGRTQVGGDLSANAAWLPPVAGRRNWRAEMHQRDVEKFEAAAGDLLTALHFERMFPTVSSSVQRQVDEVKQQFTQEVAARWRLPDTW
jgi:hypothetical protein